MPHHEDDYIPLLRIKFNYGHTFELCWLSSKQPAGICVMKAYTFTQARFYYYNK